MSKNKIFFDLDGPILNIEHKYYQVYSDIVKSLNGFPIKKNHYWKLKRNKIDDEFILKLSKISNKTNEFMRLRKKFIENNKYLTLDTLQPGALRLLKKLSKSNALILVTLRSNRVNLLSQLSNLKIDKYFSIILSGNTNKYPKWKVKASMIKKSKISWGHHSTFIGDTETDILTAKHFNIKSVAIANGIRCKEILKKYNPDYIFSNTKVLSHSLDNII